MKVISRLEGKEVVFKSEDEYKQYLSKLRSSGVVKDRSRQKRPDICKASTLRLDSIDMSLRVVDRKKVDAPANHMPWTFSLIQPSRGRPIQATACIHLWNEMASGHNTIEHILSLDTDDAGNYLPVITRTLGKWNLSVVISQNKNCVQALNAGAKYATGQVRIYLSDDFECPPNWDIEIQKAVMYRMDEWMLFVYDGIQMNTQTISIMSGAFYRRLGWMYYPEYKSMFADPDLTETAKAAHVDIQAPHLLFRHRHFSVGGMGFDSTYAKQNSKEAWDFGLAIYNRRQQQNWGIPR